MNNIGAAMKPIGSAHALTSISAAVAEGKSEVSVRAEWLDGETGHVELVTTVDGAEIVVSLDAQQAAALAAKIRSAAAYAEGEDQ